MPQEQKEGLTYLDFRISASQITKIMGSLSGGFTEVKKLRLEELEEKAKGVNGQLTDKQRVELDELNLKESLTTAQEKKRDSLVLKYKMNPLTEPQQEELKKLKEDRDKPLELPKGAKSYVEKWVKDFIIYKRKFNFQSKHTNKGNKNEDEAIEIFAKKYNLGEISKNKIRKIGEFIEGECDIALFKCIVDTKNSYTHDTFPLFESALPNHDYEGQMQGYMELWDKEFAIVAYVLTSLDEESVLKECQFFCNQNGISEITEEVFEHINTLYNYDDVHPDLRVKCFRVERNRDYIQAVNKRVEMCRDYAKKLIEEFKASRPKQKSILDNGS